MTDALDHLTAVLADQYLIEEELGRGASATVYLAQDLRHGRRVAPKVLHSALGAALGSTRFQQEIRTQARCTTPIFSRCSTPGAPGSGSTTPCRSWSRARCATDSVGPAR